MRTIESLTKEERASIIAHYSGQFSKFIKELQWIIAEVIDKNDRLALFVLIQTFNNYVNTANDQLPEQDNKDVDSDDDLNTIMGWPVKPN